MEEFVPPPFVALFAQIWKEIAGDSGEIPRDSEEVANIHLYERILKDLRIAAEKARDPALTASLLFFPPTYEEFLFLLQEIRTLKRRLLTEIRSPRLYKKMSHCLTLLMALNHVKDSIPDFYSSRDVLYYQNFLADAVKGDKRAEGTFQSYKKSLDPSRTTIDSPRCWTSRVKFHGFMTLFLIVLCGLQVVIFYVLAGPSSYFIELTFQIILCITLLVTSQHYAFKIPTQFESVIETQTDLFPTNEEHEKFLNNARKSLRKNSEFTYPLVIGILHVSVYLMYNLFRFGFLAGTEAIIPADLVPLNVIFMIIAAFVWGFIDLVVGSAIFFLIKSLKLISLLDFSKLPKTHAQKKANSMYHLVLWLILPPIIISSFSSVLGLTSWILIRNANAGVEMVVGFVILVTFIVPTVRIILRLEQVLSQNHKLYASISPISSLAMPEITPIAAPTGISPRVKAITCIGVWFFISICSSVILFMIYPWYLLMTVSIAILGLQVRSQRRV